MNSLDFWAAIDGKKAELLAAHKARKAKFLATNDPAAWEGQPTHGRGVLMMSVGSSVPYFCYAEPLRRAAQLLVEKKFRLATPEECAAGRANNDIHDFSATKAA